MKKIFEFTDCKEIYNKCILATVAHEEMMEQYPLLEDEIAWDEGNYLFMDMCGVRGVMSFVGEIFVCAIQNLEEMIVGKEAIEKKFLDGAEKEVIKLAEGEVFPYLLVDDKGNDEPAISALIWGNSKDIYCCVEEKKFIEKGNGNFLPYIYSDKDALQYWKNYYEMSEKQVKHVAKIYAQKVAEV